MSELMHYGTPRRSGRYPWGSGENPYQHESDFLNSYRKLSDQGLSEKEIAEYFGISTTQLRERKTYEKEQEKAWQRAKVLDLSNEGYSNVAIAEKLGISEGTVRNIRKDSIEENKEIVSNVTDVLKKNVADQKYIDVGTGTNLYLGVSDTKLSSALRKLQDEEGYTVNNIKVEQVGNPGKYTTVKVLAAPGTKYADILRDIYSEKAEIGIVGGYYTNNGGRTYNGIKYPASLDSSRVAINYKETGGDKLDGVIQLRPGVEDISLGNSSYAQVRIMVDGTHYIKGMAMYSDNLPKGVDVLFNTNKSQDIPMMEVLKPLKKDNDGNIDKNNPFGSTLRMEDGKIAGQRYYKDADGKEKLSPINIVRQEGDWDTWSDTLSSQFLAKQPIQLIRQQLDKTLADKKSQYDTINSITQPEVKKKLLKEFSDDCDASASHLKAAALPRQASKVILPLNSLSDKEVYAPTFRDGEQVALVRYPHGGTFEIPVLTVNNKGEGKKILGQAIDAIGINSKVAQRLSGADFDGDTVVVIPMAGQKIKSSKSLGLEDFDPKQSYPQVPGMKVLNKRQKQIEMGKVSNLITDMTIKGAPTEDITRAVRHSMVVIDAEKHKLNYKQSEIDNGIEELKQKYQKKDNGKYGGVSTLISKAGHEVNVRVYKEEINPKTGEIVRNYDKLSDKEKYKTKYKVDKKTGEKIEYKVERTQPSTLMKEHKDARELSSGYAVENIYADYANNLKSMANNARKEMISTPNTTYSPSAKETYKYEVSSLNSKLNTALKNKPRERKAQVVANVRLSAKKRSNPDMDEDELKKQKTQLLAAARAEIGASKRDVFVNVTEKEWEAMMNGALSSSKISQILSNMNPDRVKQLALPREAKTLSTSQKSRINSLYDNGYTISQIADSIGVSTTVVSNYLMKEGEGNGK